MHFALACSHFPENSFLLTNWQFCARFSNCSNSLNFEAKINFITTRQNDLKWRKTCTGLKFDLVHFNGPQTKFIVDSLYEHPVSSFVYKMFIYSFIYLDGLLPCIFFSCCLNFDISLSSLPQKEQLKVLLLCFSHRFIAL